VYSLGLAQPIDGSHVLSGENHAFLVDSDIIINIIRGKTGSRNLSRQQKHKIHSDVILFCFVDFYNHLVEHLRFSVKTKVHAHITFSTFFYDNYVLAKLSEHPRKKS